MKFYKLWQTLSEKNQPQTKQVYYKTPFDVALRLRNMSYNNGYHYIMDIMNNCISDNKVVICKGSQLGFSDCLVTLTIFLVLNKKPCLYILPSADEIRDFSSARFNGPISNSGQTNETDNVHHKIINGTSLYLRGAHSRSKLKSISVQYLIIDEYEEHDEEMIELARERLSGFKEKHEIDFSTPRLFDTGIFKEYKQCDQYKYYIKCSKCDYYQELILEDNLLNFNDNYYHCSKCKLAWFDEERVDMISKGAWQLVNKGNGTKGYHISQLYSPTITGEEIKQKYYACDNDISKQEFFNSKLGLPFESNSNRIARDTVLKAIREFNSNALPKVAGIDVSQTSNHYMIIMSKCEYGCIIEQILRPTWEEIPGIIKELNIQRCIIDANPERYKAKELRTIVGNGVVYLALYPKMRSLCSLTPDRVYIQINRTEAIDNILNYYEKNRILIRNTCTNIEELISHTCNVVRSYRRSRLGVIEPYYVEIGADHFMHATVYADIAATILAKPIDAITGNFII